ncbi:MAG: PQQ-dependent sugar dehydrogenase [Pyrinomonadaceae bacterium]
MRISKGFLLFWIILTSTLSGCGQKPTGISESEIIVSKPTDGRPQTKFRIETVAEGLEVPWGMVFLENGDMLFTERPGRVRKIADGKLVAAPVLKVPDVEPSGESGLMDISLHPDFENNKFVYLAYAYNKDGKHVKVVRYKYDGSSLKEDKTIIEGIPGAPNHAGTRARFGPDKKLYVTTGDATDWNLAQNKKSLAGKTLRLNDDGSVPKDNPFVENSDYLPQIWTIGHRNAQGLAWQPGSGLMFQTSHGPSYFEGRGGGADEVNIVERGKNYGWPEIYGMKEKAGMEKPLLEYSPACAPASAMFYDADKLPGFKGNLFFGCLRGTRIIRVVLDGRRVVGQENLLEGKFGRIRAMELGLDGYIYFSTSNRDSRGTPADTDDRIMRIVPAEK